jgi:hypothetical protein
MLEYSPHPAIRFIGSIVPTIFTGASDFASFPHSHGLDSYFPALDDFPYGWSKGQHEYLLISECNYTFAQDEF